MMLHDVTQWVLRAFGGIVKKKDAILKVQLCKNKMQREKKRQITNNAVKWWPK